MKTNLLVENKAKQLLRRGLPVVIFNVFESLRPSVVKIVDQLGYDLLLIETEHMQHNPENLTNFLVMARDHGLSPVITISDQSRGAIGRFLDAGAMGFCLSHAETVEQVEQLISWMKYPPEGIRALAHGPNADYRMDDARRYCVEANDATMLLLKIESQIGIENAEAMMQVKGVDGIVFGPGDLACDMNCHGEWESPDVVAAMENVIEKALEKGIPIEASLSVGDAAEYERQRSRGIQLFGPARSSEYDHLRMGAELAIAPFRAREK